MNEEKEPFLGTFKGEEVVFVPLKSREDWGALAWHGWRLVAHNGKECVVILPGPGTTTEEKLLEAMGFYEYSVKNPCLREQERGTHEQALESGRF